MLGGLLYGLVWLKDIDLSFCEGWLLNRVFWRLRGILNFDVCWCCGLLNFWGILLNFGWICCLGGLLNFCGFGWLVRLNLGFGWLCNLLNFGKSDGWFGCLLNFKVW